MKKILFAAMAATVLFASCAKEGNNNPEVAGETAKLTISFDNPANTRAFDATSETEIKSATAFVLSADGAIMKKFSVNVADPTEEYEVTTAANKVLVIANANLSSITATTLTALKKEVATLEALDGETNGFFASGTSSALNFSQTASDGDSKLATATVTMKLLPARLDVTVTNNMTNYDGSTGLILDKVAVLYSSGFSHWVAATENGTNFYPATATISAISGAKYFRSGFEGWDSDDSDQNVVLSDLVKPWSASFAETFYVYPTLPAASTLAYGRNTILVVSAIWKGEDGSLSEPRYFPVHFSTTDKGELESGKKYSITVNLKGNAGATGGGGGGVTDPEEEVIPAYIDVTVSIAGWVAAPAITKEFE